MRSTDELFLFVMVFWQTAHFFIKMKMVSFFFVVVVAACTCFVVAQDGVSQLSVSLDQWVLCAWCMAQVSHGCVFFCFSTMSLLHALLLISLFLWREIWGMNMPNLSKVFCLEDLLLLGCVCCTCIAAIDASLVMIVVAGWALLWYSQCPHDPFVAFVGEAALWLRGWLPWLSSLGSWDPHLVSTLALHNDGVDCIHCNQWWLWSLIVPIVIGNGIIACCCLLQLCLVPMHALSSQLGFLIV